MAIHVGDDDYDNFVTWSSVWEPSPEENSLKKFIVCHDHNECEHDGRKEGNDNSWIDLERLVENLQTIIPKIDWRIGSTGYDEYTEGFWQWENISVPDEQAFEAEVLIGKIKKSDNITLFTCIEDFYPCLYTKQKILLDEITTYIQAAKSFRAYICNDYAVYFDNTKNQLVNLILVLNELYSASCSLNLLNIDANLPDYDESCFDDYSFNLDMYDKYNQNNVFLMEGDDLYDFFDGIVDICKMIGGYLDDFDSYEPHDIEKIVAYWQVKFKYSIGSSILKVLTILHEVVFDHGSPKRN